MNGADLAPLCVPVPALSKGLGPPPWNGGLKPRLAVAFVDLALVLLLVSPSLAQPLPLPPRPDPNPQRQDSRAPLLQLRGTTLRNFDALPEAAPVVEDPYSAARKAMVEKQVLARGIEQPELLEAMVTVPRHLFVPAELRHEAYEDRSLPIGWGQFISQPYLSARMIELLDLDEDDRVLEIGTGSGYDAALLSRIARDVYTIEIIERLAHQTLNSLQSLGYDNVQVRVGDGYQGWPQEAPFDAILLTAAPPRIPQPLVDQLKVGGRMVVPLGQLFQDLLVITKTPHGIERQKIEPVRLGPMSGEIQKDEP